MTKKIIAVAGPTASGKTALAIELAKRFSGEVVSCEVLPSKSYNHNDEGKVVVSEKEGFASVKIVGKMQGQLTDLGAVIGGETYGVGHTFTVRMGKAKMYLKISDIK